MYTVYADPLETADMSSGLTKYAPFVFTKATILVAARVGVVFYNDPTFTALSLAIYSNNAGAPGKLIATSTNSNMTKAAVLTTNSAHAEVYFDFNSVPHAHNETYHFVLRATGYTASAGSYIALARTWPDPIYRDDFERSYESLLTSDYQMSFFGAKYE